MNAILILLAIGLAAGMLSGLVGVGGGIIIVPVLVFFLGYTQHHAQGTTLFLFMLPVGVLGVYNYYKAGNVDFKAALIIGCTFLVGSYIGSKAALALDQNTVKKLFGILIFIVSLRMIFGK
ncbi:MAG: sulfite exporter TauE/SafE family protein [Bacteroidetes bacterium]|nr:sulfite exporter TauE/SafE family protein [Bacteroidota bacterium]